MIPSLLSPAPQRLVIEIFGQIFAASDYLGQPWLVLSQSSLTRINSNLRVLVNTRSTQDRKHSHSSHTENHFDNIVVRLGTNNIRMRQSELT